MTNIGPFVSPYGLESIGLSDSPVIHWNLTAPALYTAAIKNSEASIASGGALIALTGEHTGRSPNDKFVVSDKITENEIEWGSINKPYLAGDFELIFEDMTKYLKNKELFVQDCFAGADPTHRLAIRVVSEYAWHNLFARNLFITPSVEDIPNQEPDFTIIQAPGFKADPKRHNTNSSTCILVDFSKRLVLIGGTSYAGECKKSVFSILNFLLPASNVLPMHCSVNVGESEDAAVFFGLSGTGKTTLSADPNRKLIGDDEHGWSSNGLFNFEGGCYAKVIRLSQEAEPEIFATTKMFGTVLENVVMDPNTRVLDLDNPLHTENTRGAYPLSFIPNASKTGIAGHPKNVIMLTADAFGVLPPISKLTPAQAMYHFLSGYTAKVAGTEKGLGSEPQATFSTCFGAPFMPRHPSVYAQMLRERLEDTGANCWLVNTGWTGGQYGVGKRMEISITRSLLKAALDGTLSNVQMKFDESFGLQIPTSCPGVDPGVLTPRDTWNDKNAYDNLSSELVGRFHENFIKFKDHVTNEVLMAAPQAV
ncbi:MAG: phosphoenolpyruvate carboxykinase (ATP) [Rhodospirillaceae bacterium]|nr:phosphoenolpyruvate carboxykinase (ATP) [Rhodospirillaceae bacterium]|tara:strand:+ start:4722 stop:6329 length:1608 start_codon:yes stop_codon:yes gene_type:complete